MSWRAQESTEDREGQDRSRSTTSQTRPSRTPSLFRYIGIAAVGAVGSVAAFVASVAYPQMGPAIVAGSTATAAAIAQGITEFLKSRAETSAEDAYAAHQDAPRVTASTSGALEQAHALIAAVLGAINEVDALAAQVYDDVEASGGRLAGAFGGGDTSPAELSFALGHNLTVRTRLERAHRALDGAAAALGRFDTRTLQV